MAHKFQTVVRSHQCWTLVEMFLPSLLNPGINVRTVFVKSWHKCTTVFVEPWHNFHTVVCNSGYLCWTLAQIYVLSLLNPGTKCTYRLCWTPAQNVRTLFVKPWHNFHTAVHNNDYICWTLAQMFAPSSLNPDTNVRTVFVEPWHKMFVQSFLNPG